jgi:hypothetical protein
MSLSLALSPKMPPKKGPVQNQPSILTVGVTSEVYPLPVDEKAFPDAKDFVTECNACSVYACMRVFIYMCMCGCVDECMGVCMRVCVHACMRVCVHVCMHACIYVSCPCMYACMCQCSMSMFTYSNFKKCNFKFSNFKKIRVKPKPDPTRTIKHPFQTRPDPYYKASVPDPTRPVYIKS